MRCQYGHTHTHTHTPVPGAPQQVMSLFYKATVQAILLYSAEMWTLTQPLLHLLHSFHHRCAWYLARMVNTQNADGTWTTPASAAALEAAGLFTIEEYIQCQVNTFLPFIQSWAIYWECHFSRATQAAATHPCWWTINPGPPVPLTPVTPILGHNVLADHDPSNDVPPPPLPLPPHRSPCCKVIVV